MTYNEEILNAKETATKIRKELDDAWTKLGYSPVRNDRGNLEFIEREEDWRKISEDDLRKLITEAIYLVEYASSSLHSIYNQTVRLSIEDGRIIAKLETHLEPRRFGHVYV